MSAILALAIFVVAFSFIATERVSKVTTVLVAAGAMAVLGLIPGAGVFYSEHEGIDWTVVFLLFGMMIIVGIIKPTGVFDYLAIWAAKRSRGRPYRLMVMLMLITAIASPFLDNVTTVMLVAPVTIVVCNRLRIPAQPYLIAEVLAANIGGGDPDRRPAEHHHRQPRRPDVQRLPRAHGPGGRRDLRGVRAADEGVVPQGLRLQPGPGRRGARAAGAAGDQGPEVAGPLPVVLTGVVVGFGLHSVLPVEPSVVALVGAGVMYLVSGADANEVLNEVEWPTLAFFAGLFVMVAGLVHTGLIATAGETLWWAFALGADFSGNGTAVAASANLVMLGIAARAGHRVSFWQFTRYGIVVTVLSILLAWVYVWLRYFT